MSLSTLISGADCGPSNALQSLTKRVGGDRGLQQDFFGPGRAGPSNQTFRTAVAPDSQLNEEKAHFFNAHRIPPAQGAFDFGDMHGALPHEQRMAGLPSLTPAFQERIQQDKGNADAWAAEFMMQAQGQALPRMSSHPSLQATSIHPVQPIASAFRGPGFMGPLTMPPGPMPTLASDPVHKPVSHLADWEQEFSRLMDESKGQTAENPVPVDGDELSRTAGLLIETLKDETNPKFKQSAFMGFMRQIRDREMVVEGDKIVPASEATAIVTTATDLSAATTTTVRGRHASASPTLRDREGSVDNWPMKSVHFNPVTETSSIVNQPDEMSEEDAYWQAENRDYKDYWDKAAALPSASTIDPLAESAQQREWGELQESWDSWEATSSGVRQVAAPTYGFQTNNPYVFDKRLMTSDWRTAPGSDVGILEREAAVLNEPQNAEAWYNLGVKQQANEREAKAIQALRKAVELDPSLLPAWMELSVSYTNDGSKNDAYVAINEWITRNPKYKDVVAQWKAGRASTSSTSLVEDLIDCLVSMARAVPDGELDADVQIALGVLLNTTEDYDKAKDCFLAAVDVRPDDYLLYNRVGATMANHGNPREALPYYHKALALNPSYVRARFNMAISCISLQQNEEAAGHILDALVLQENDGLQTEERGVGSSVLWDTLRNVCLYMHRQDLARICDKRDLLAFRGAFEMP
ncbi:related to peroxisomal targeting signal receptor [Serendipita indica DSM 11827]|uniref:Related to peroxisomal targeting signal receptor n=1 Tax=Serendipita indica (strain DSM 11827) TaxID=1109443 RepID=G4T4W2_SERID|nr:related to peroxisomal targeting signal receptor [Serendipita indica DSM 11827]